MTLEDGEQLEATSGHPFYVQGKGWNAAANLKVGDALLLHNGTTVVVATVDSRVGWERVYNFSVAGNANYFVGSGGVGVHNANCSISLPTDEALDEMLKHLGEGYKEIAPGVFKSLDGTKLARITDSDLAKIGNHAGAPHINLETGRTVIKPNGKESFITHDNIHIFLPGEK